MEVKRNQNLGFGRLCAKVPQGGHDFKKFSQLQKNIRQLVSERGMADTITIDGKGLVLDIKCPSRKEEKKLGARLKEMGATVVSCFNSPKGNIKAMNVLSRMEDQLIKAPIQ